MTNRRIKYSIFILFWAAYCIYGWGGSRVIAYTSGPPNGVTGAPGEITCSTAGCHNSFPINSGPGSLTLSGLPANYSLNQEIELAVTLNQTNRALYGFELTAIDDLGKKAGDLIITELQRTQKSSENTSGNLREYLTHTLDGASPSGTNQNRWTFKWKAPAQNVGRVRFFIAGNAANGSGTPTGDFIYTISASVQPPAVVASIANVSAASFAADAALAPESIAAAFSLNLATSTTVATTVPLPTELDGAQLIVLDSLGTERRGQLFFISPGQINYVIPQGTASGPATAIVRRTGADIAQGTVPIEPVAPGIFSANANGLGVAAAVLFWRKANGEESFEPVAQFNQTTNRFEAVPIDLGAETDQVFLILFGTGFRNRSSLLATTCTIGGINAEVIFAGSQGDFAGLDQTNIRIPRSLLGRGNVDLIFKADNKTANPVTITVK